jgi:hypothetical protein
MAKYADRVLETSTTTGTGDITLAGAVTGYRTFNAAIGTQVNFDYCIVAVDGSGVPTGDWEVGEGYLSASTTLVRSVLLSSSTGAAVSFSAGTKRVFITHPAEEVIGKGFAVAAAAQYMTLP